MERKEFPVPSKYEAYLQSADFDEIRQKVFVRDGFRCVVCKSDKDIAPHHLTYQNIYHEDPRDLVTLCRRCHSIFHNIDNRRKAIEEYYSADHAASQEDWKKQLERKRAIEESLQRDLSEEIKEKYLPMDYGKGGCLDLMDWSVLNPIIEKERKAYGLDYVKNKTEIRNYFLYRRCELLLRCLDKGLTEEQILEQTSFSRKWLSEWYRREKCEAKLKEEMLLQEEE